MRGSRKENKTIKHERDNEDKEMWRYENKRK